MLAVAPRIRAPELAPGEWPNTSRPVRLAEWRGKAVLVDFWDFTCYQHAGEGAYAETEAALARLAAEATRLSGSPDAARLPRPMGALRDEDQPGAVCFRTTPELHTGYNRGALGNREGYLPRGLPMIYRLPPQP